MQMWERVIQHETARYHLTAALKPFYTILNSRKLYYIMNLLFFNSLSEWGAIGLDFFTRHQIKFFAWTAKRPITMTK